MAKQTETERIINIIKGLIAITIYFSMTRFLTLPLIYFHIDYNNLPILTKEIYNLCAEGLIITIIYSIFKNQYKQAWQDLKKNHYKYFSQNLKFYILGLFLMMAANSLITVFGGAMADNETAIRSQFELAPIYTFISAVFLAPVLEESIFRLSFRNIFTNNFIYILLSGLVFGSLHLISGISSLELLPLYLVSYCSLGFIFAYMITKTNNIFVTIGFHMMHNGILMNLQILLLLFS